MDAPWREYAPEDWATEQEPVRKIIEMWSRVDGPTFAPFKRGRTLAMEANGEPPSNFHLVIDHARMAARAMGLI